MSKTKTAAAVLVLWVLAMVVQSQLDPRRHYYNPMLEKGARANFVESLRENAFGASFLGFREVVAGMLWVKADELFHEGRYQELVPYFSLVTFMDPHQTDVYSTGAWHLMYNFGDPRMIPQGLAFLKEGIQNNPNVWDLYFQRGWVTFDWPVENYAESLPYFKSATKYPGVNGDPTPPFVSHMVAHNLERLGRLEEAKDRWQADINFAEKKMAAAQKAKDATEITYWQQERDVCRMNLDRLVVREIARADLSKNPRAVRIEASVKKQQPRVLQVNAKVLGLPHMIGDDGSTSNARLEVVLQDKDYDKLLAQHKGDFSWIANNLTRYRSIYNIVEANGVVTDKGKPYMLVELNKDPMLDPPRNPTELYPLQSQNYELILRLDPSVRRQPKELQDVLGWTGEGLKASPQVVKGPSGERMLEVRIPLTKDQITE
jgi:tetratricopeptide (TPR) repeat protein